MDNLKFDQLPLSKEIQKAIQKMGFEEASPIQSQAIPHILEGKDIIGQAQTGTGKTAAFGIPAVEMVDPKEKKVQAVVLTPTRELAIQVAEELRKLCEYKKDIKILPIYGGQPIERQILALKKGIQVVIGTPGRVMDHMRRRTLKMETVKMIVLDEADEMLDMGFVEDIETILHEMPEQRQTIFFSATMPKEILNLTKKYQKDPQIVKVVHRQLTVPNIEQAYFELKEKAKLEVLTRLIDLYNPKLSVIFCNTKKRVDEVVAQLQTRGYFADGLHGDMKQSQRDRVMSKFRTGTIEVLVATDVAARGIDVDDVEAVFNYDVPQDEEYYVHRIGRTGRAGRSGQAFTFVVGKEIYKLKDIERYTKSKIQRMNIPTLNDVEERKVTTYLERVKTTIDEGHLSKYMHYVESLLEEYNTIDIAAALLKLQMGEERNDDAGMLEQDNTDLDNTGAEPGMVRLFINIGRKHKVRPKDLVGAIAGEVGISGKLIGSIDILEQFSFVEVPKEYARDVIHVMKNNQIKGVKVNIEPANGKK